MKKSIIITLLMCLSMHVAAQTLIINSMKAMPMDLSASTNPRKDLNDKVCALVKVSLTIPNATFSGNPIGNVARDGSDYWVYLPEGSKRMWVKHPNFKELEIDFAKYGIQRLQSKMTYKIDVEVPQMQQVAVVVPAEAKPAIEEAKTAKKRGKFDAIGMFFPLYGITLGKTTHADVEKIGYGVEFRKYDAFESFTLKNVIFSQIFASSNTFNNMSVNGNDMPKQWKEKYGFDGSLSFNQWKKLLNDLGFDVEVLSQPTIEEMDGIDYMAAKLTATAPDFKLRFTLDFRYGNRHGEGISPDSPETLYELICETPGKGNIPESILKKSDASAKSFKVSDAIKEFFPVYGVTLGKSSFRDIINKGYIVYDDVKDDDGTPLIRAEINGWLAMPEYYVNDKVLFHHFGTTNNNIPEKWIAKGFQFENSYNTWIKVLENLDYTVVETKKPVEAKPDSKDSFSAELRAISPDATMRIDLDFNYGTGKTKDAANTLYSIAFETIDKD